MPKSNPRIISGSAKGIRLRSVPGTSTRPVTDRVKEALFNIIGADILDSSMLDLFAGTGSIGIEALSRGARFVRMLDINKTAINILHQNLEKTGLTERADVVHVNSIQYINRPANLPFDYIYIAPPQYQGTWQIILNALDDNLTWLSNDGWVIAQIHPIEYMELDLKNLTRIDERVYGSTQLVFYARS
ncbi:MAG: 16S rRNA (guanine(966)-N(2))-methyltransferase RsmD [Anaerolineae bacterium]|jgi:16S rRNA (guanine(966)-N(2))-methyltransferase RsmD|nr:16S rRNA (guanine(966)-N(2))-methyltransferase RsmD [Anaerolineae bacterium]